MAKSKLPSKWKTLFTGNVTICGKTRQMELKKALCQDGVERFTICIPGFCAIPLGPSLEVVFDFLRGIGLKLGSKPKNQQGKLIFQAKTDFPNLPQRQAIGVKIYKTANNDYECVLSKLFNPPCAPLYGRNSFTESTLEDIFSQIEDLKTFYGRNAYNVTPNLDF